MNEKSSSHRNCQDFLQRLGTALGFDVEIPDIGWHSYSLERVSKGRRPDVIWNFKNTGMLFEGRKNLKLSEPYAIFEVESITGWADIKRHLDNIKEMGLEPHIVFAVFYDGTIRTTEKEELVEYARRLGFRLEISYEKEMVKIFGEIVDNKILREIEEIKNFCLLCDRIKRLTYSNLFRKGKENSNFIIRSSEVFEGDYDSFQRLQLGSCIKIGETVYRFEVNAYASELIGNLRLLYKDKHTFSRIPFFASINEILKSNIWKKLEDEGVENYVRHILELTSGCLDKELTGARVLTVLDSCPNILSMKDIKYALEISRKFEIWNKVFKNILQIRSRLDGCKKI